ncbi:MAG TPA: hypothetical protein VGO52_02045 [Hyphomonadaceae bacterium]|jgi:hypothetical protein|nr:hypothetical protein [Hyphomonadaceae bacterium]
MIKPKQVFLGCSFKKRTSSYIYLALDVADQFDVTLVFGDNNPRASDIRDQAFKLISTSRVVILDIVPDNVNVGVEFGFAQGAKKKDLYLLTRKPFLKSVQLPSMFQGLQYKSYRGEQAFGDRIEACLAEHYRKRNSVIEQDDPSAEPWLKREIDSLVNELGRTTRGDLAAILNCAGPDITKAANVLHGQGLIGREANGYDTIYFRLPNRVLEPV